MAHEDTMVDSLVEFVGNDITTPDRWNLYFDYAFHVKGSRAWIILEGLDDMTLEQALKLNFRVSNN